MLVKQIGWYGATAQLACDGRCDKAWGINGRPKRSLSDDPDDYVFLSDDALGVAPGPGETVGVSDGGHMKPSAVPLTEAESDRMNKWCIRECERSEVNDTGREFDLPDLANPSPNKGSRNV